MRRGVPNTETGRPKPGELRLPRRCPAFVRLKMFCTKMAGVRVKGSAARPNWPPLGEPSLNVLAMRKLRLTNVGFVPRLRGISDCPGAGLGSKAPKRVTITPGALGLVAKAGRSVKTPSPFESIPVMMLKVVA